ncbi:Terrein cluster-specific transcription factor terR [Lachnellula suecica]|uniref:Terrein cluster-specific transcription factor terR n=1 Tax=Lachnellula suecica TaxID=602035 RepID=A0A8T9CHB4_9HELO|nr:Terrein cluster-specific transcription factor terR [Lachnellula suecica]
MVNVNSIPAYSTETQNTGQLSPPLTAASTENGRSSITDSLNTVSTMDYAEDSAWNVDIDPEGIHSLLPTTDIRNILDLSRFSWPTTATDNDYQFDFDIPFTTEPTEGSTGVNSVALTDDGSSFLNQTTRPFEPTDSGDMVRMLDLNDKVTTRSFLDPIPSVNFSLKAIFLWQDRGHENMSSAKQNEIYRIFERISPVQAQQSSIILNDKEYRNSYASWYWNDAALMENCKTACFEQPLGVPNFLTRSYFDRLLKEARGRPQGNSVLISLIDSVMAFGFHAFLKTSRRYVSSHDKKEADYYSRIALNSYASVLSSPNTLLKLQTILAMTTVSEQIDENIHSEILTGAVNCARTLKLENSDSIRNDYTSNEDRELARRSLWFLYSIENPHSLRRGLSPSLDRDWIDHAPPQACDETDWFPIQCEYAHIISSAAKMLYSQSALRQSLVEREQNLEIAFKLLEDWRSHLPNTLKDIHKPDIQRILDDQHLRHIALSMFRQYHEAIFMIYYPWTGAHSGGRISEDCRRRGKELCVNSAQVVLATSNQVSSLDILDSKFLDLISVSICMTFLDVASSTGAEKSISYLSMGCGIFGRLNLESEVPLADVLELTRIAQQIKGR